MTEPPRVFISYSHDSYPHRAQVLNFAQSLRKNGIDADLDQFHAEIIQNWSDWCRKKISPEETDFIICVCTAEYRSRINGNVPPERGKGVYWEGQLMQAQLYNGKGNRRIIPVLFNDEPKSSIIDILSNYTHCSINEFEINDYDYETLIRILTEQPRIKKEPLGQLPSLACREAAEQPPLPSPAKWRNQNQREQLKMQLVGILKNTEFPIDICQKLAIYSASQILMSFTADVFTSESKCLITDIINHIDNCDKSDEKYPNLIKFAVLFFETYRNSAHKNITTHSHAPEPETKLKNWIDSACSDLSLSPDEFRGTFQEDALRSFPHFVIQVAFKQSPLNSSHLYCEAHARFGCIQEQLTIKSKQKPTCEPNIIDILGSTILRLTADNKPIYILNKTNYDPVHTGFVFGIDHIEIITDNSNISYAWEYVSMPNTNEPTWLPYPVCVRTFKKGDKQCPAKKLGEQDIVKIDDPSFSTKLIKNGVFVGLSLSSKHKENIEAGIQHASIALWTRDVITDDYQPKLIEALTNCAIEEIPSTIHKYRISFSKTDIWSSNAVLLFDPPNIPAFTFSDNGHDAKKTRSINRRIQ